VELLDIGSSQTVSIQFDVAQAIIIIFFLAYFAGFLINIKGLNACRHCWALLHLIVFQRFSDYCIGGDGDQVSSGETEVVNEEMR